jgi:glycopeptide antibiotics resistance protein
MKIAYDKKLHFIVGLVIAVIFAFIFKSASMGYSVAFIAGLGKELRDEFVYGGFDICDLLTTGLGGIAGALIYGAFYG